VNAESERQAAAQAGHPGAQASATQVEHGERSVRQRQPPAALGDGSAIRSARSPGPGSCWFR
jgi:hypothetical protein